MLHYAPISATLEGEPPETFPFLGSSRLEDPLDRYAVALVCHGHAQEREVLGMTVPLAPAEETLWSKAFIQKRKRYDGTDVAHILRSCAATLAWPRARKSPTGRPPSKAGDSASGPFIPGPA